MLKQIKVYLKLTVLVALTLVGVLVVYYNRNHRVDVWFFRTFESINVLWLILCIVGGTLVSWWLLSLSVGVWRDVRELSRSAAERTREEEQATRARLLEEKEKRIDEKLKQALGDESRDH
ncbi:MAG: hypothetical protein HOP29_00550 [Phycisphaerales bacterium]|nr:hypothetical protein [Phycisphaerales bacterium]